MQSSTNQRRRMDVFRERHRKVQELLFKNADASRQVSKCAEDSRNIIDRVSLMGIDDPRYFRNFKMLCVELRMLVDEVNGVSKTQFIELRKNIIDSIHDQTMSTEEFIRFVETCEQQIGEIRKKIEDEFTRLSDKFGRYCTLYEHTRVSDTPRPKGDLKMHGGLGLK